MLTEAAGERGRLILARLNPCTNVAQDAGEAQRSVASVFGGEHEKEFLELLASFRSAAQEVGYRCHTSLLLWTGCTQGQRHSLRVVDRTGRWGTERETKVFYVH